MAEIRIENLHKRFADFVAVRDSTFTVRDGEFFCLLGPSGCGKTTTLRMIAGLELPTSGQITLGGEDVTFQRASQRDIAMVFQLFALYPHMNVRAQHRVPAAQRRACRAPRSTAEVDEAARILRIEHLLDKPVSRPVRRRPPARRARPRHRAPAAGLPDGRAAGHARRRVPRADVPRAAQAARPAARDHRVRHARPERGDGAGRHIVVMNQGEIEQLGAPQEVYNRPACVFVADFIGSPPMNFLPFDGRLRAGATQVRVGDAPVAVPALREDAPPRTLLLGVRPEHVRFARRLAAARRGARHRVPRLAPDRHAAAPRTARRCRRAVDVDVPAQRGDQRRPGVRHRAACRCSTPPAAARCAPRATTTSAPHARARTRASEPRHG